MTTTKTARPFAATLLALAVATGGTAGQGGTTQAPAAPPAAKAHHEPAETGPALLGRAKFQLGRAQKALRADDRKEAAGHVEKAIGFLRTRAGEVAGAEMEKLTALASDLGGIAAKIGAEGKAQAAALKDAAGRLHALMGQGKAAATPAAAPAPANP